MNVGIDIEEISRFTKLKYEKHRNFYEKIFSQNEIDYCLQKADPYPHFTVRFCAKEAAIKALGDEKIGLKNIEVVMKNKVPSLKISGKQITKVSLSHSQNTAIAIVMYFD